MITAISNVLWIVPVLVGMLTSFATSAPQKFYSMTLYGMFVAVALRIVVLASIFFEKITYGFIVAFIQPVAQMLAVFFGNYALISSVQTFVLGSIVAASALVYLIQVNRTGKGFLREPPLKLLRAFLQAWTENEAKLFEEIFEEASTAAKVKTKIITFQQGSGKPTVVVPEIHPGPFYPIGSSNLPYELREWFTSNGYSSLVLHGVSGHDLNLPSRTTVERFISSLQDLRTLGTGNTCTLPLKNTAGKATVTGIAFGDFAFIIITLAPHGMEDFPQSVKETVERKALELGYRGAFVVDAHNSLGKPPTEDECNSAIEAAGIVLQKLRRAKQKPFKIGYAHSSELNIGLKADIGPAGICAIVFEIDGTLHSLVSFDSNNASIGFREKLLEQIKDVDVIEVCTTDTHFNAAKVMNENGYDALGGITKIDDVSSTLNKLIKIASSKMVESDFMISGIETEVKVVGGKLLSDFSAALDSVTRIARKGGITLAAIAVLMFLLTAVM
jgi:putative membrane protein